MDCGSWSLLANEALGPFIRLRPVINGDLAGVFVTYTHFIRLLHRPALHPLLHFKFTPLYLSLSPLFSLNPFLFSVPLSTFLASHLSHLPLFLCSLPPSSISLLLISPFLLFFPVLLLSGSAVKLLLGSEEGTKRPHCLPVSYWQNKKNDCFYIHITGMLHLKVKFNISRPSNENMHTINVHEFLLNAVVLNVECMIHVSGNISYIRIVLC